MSQREDYMPDDDGSINVGSSGFPTKKTTTNLRQQLPQLDKYSSKSGSRESPGGIDEL